MDETKSNDKAGANDKAGDKKPKKSFFEGSTSFLKGLSGSIEDSNNEIKSLDGKKASVLTLLKRKQQGPPYKHLDDYSWARYVITWSNIDILASLFFTLFIWYAVYAAYTRPLYNITTASTLETQLTSYDAVPSLDEDVLALWTVQTVELLHQVDSTGKNFLPMLAGQVNPSILAKFYREYETKRAEIAEYEMVKNVNISTVLGQYVNEEDKRMTIYISGYVTRTAKEDLTKATAPLPRVQINYAAEVIAQQTLPTKLNPTGLYMERLTERYGQSAIDWVNELNLK